MADPCAASEGMSALSQLGKVAGLLTFSYEIASLQTNYHQQLFRQSQHQERTHKVWPIAASESSSELIWTG